ncbi:hypothetical protein POTOM_061375 [Populus tomentosa]|uniref:RNase H type-1 domain-containing protein n=1 Tax=Populus tomentosa TaxID=118781 RepID=A0A8X7XPA5_POPTO|nr:hypothetical protein POTOM_061375 [Populus tomentosa]
MVAGILATEFGYLLVLVIDGALINMPEQVQQVKQLIRGFSSAFSLPTGSVSSRAAELVSWKVPDVDWCKLNGDGSVLATSGAAGIGGLIRELSGQWITYFSCFNGPSSIILAELWSSRRGIELTVSLGCQKLVESDSMEAIILLLTSDIADHHPQDALIKDTRAQHRSGLGFSSPDLRDALQSDAVGVMFNKV